METFDVIIIGAGPGGYEAAAHAGKFGLKTLLIEKTALGGTCLNCGCIPTKTLLAAAHFYNKIKKNSNLFGIKTENTCIDYPKNIERKDRLIMRLQKGIEKLLQENKVTVIKGEALLFSHKKVIVDNSEYSAENIIIATGNTPSDIPGLQVNGQNIFNSSQILNLKEVPKTLGIVGAGVIGLEFADIFSSLGSQVTIMEIMDKVLPGEDQEAVGIVKKSLESRGVKFYLGETAKSVDKEQFEKILVAVGRKINTECIKDPDIKLGSKQEIAVNDQLETSVPGIYAIGDVNNLAIFAHAATYQGIKVIDNIKNKTAEPIKLSIMPKVVFTSPQIASIGKTTGQNTKKIPLALLGKAQAENQTEGFLKIFINDQQIIEGVVIVAENADALIGEAVVIVNTQTTVEKLKNMIHPHPTFSEIFSELLK